MRLRVALWSRSPGAGLTTSPSMSSPASCPGREARLPGLVFSARGRGRAGARAGGRPRQCRGDCCRTSFCASSGLLLVVIVEAAPGLGPEPAVVDVFPQQATRALRDPLADG